MENKIEVLEKQKKALLELCSGKAKLFMAMERTVNCLEAEITEAWRKIKIIDDQIFVFKNIENKQIENTFKELDEFLPNL